MDDQGRFQAAVKLKAQGQFAVARAILEDLRLQLSSSAAFHAVLGDVYWEMGLLEDAILSFRQATALSPSSEIASLGLFHCLWEKGGREEAVAEAKRFLKTSESQDYRDILSELGLSIERKGERG